MAAKERPVRGGHGAGAERDRADDESVRASDG
jgi:hypothetical protein